MIIVTTASGTSNALKYLVLITWKRYQRRRFQSAMLIWVSTTK